MKVLLSEARLLALLLTVAFLVAACGGSSGGLQGGKSGGSDKKESAEKGGGEMDHDQMGHGMGTGGMARQMVMESGEYSDKAFIDAMVPHHQGAIEMARVALGNAEHEEVKELSQNIVSTQQSEIGKLKSIKRGIWHLQRAHGDEHGADAGHGHDDGPATVGEAGTLR